MTIQLERVDVDQLWDERDAAVTRLARLSLGDCTRTEINEACGLIRAIKRTEMHLRDADEPPPPGGWAVAVEGNQP